MAKKRAYHKSNKQLRQERKRAQRKAFYDQHRKTILITAVSAIVALILIVLAVDYFYVSEGAMRTFLGNLCGVEDSMVIREVNGNYYELARMETPEGYQPEAYVSAFTADDREQLLYFVAEDDSRLINNVYVAGVKEKKGADMVAELTASSSAYYAMVSDPKSAQIGGYDVNYFFAHTLYSSSEEDQYSALLVMYVDTVQNSTVLVNCATSAMAEADLPTEEAMLAEAEIILSGLTLPEGV